MSRILMGVVLGFSLFLASAAAGQGLLIPTDKSIPPLEIKYQRVNVEIEDQAAVTRVEQEFQNEASTPLEAHYVFPVPAGAGVDDFAMWIDGKRTTGEVVEAKHARKIYEDVVRRLKDPGLLEHMGDNLYRVRVFPVPPKGTQKIEISFSQIAKRDAGIADYVYPLKACGTSYKTEQDFTMRVTLNSKAPLKSVYSPSHDVGVSRDGQHRAVIGFEANAYDLTRDFQLFWTVSEKDVGLSLISHRESPGEDGYFLALICPAVDLDTENVVPRDVVFVVDTSGSMQGEKIEQAKRALQFCLKSLTEKDRFAILSFATTTNLFEESLNNATSESITKAGDWVGRLTATGGTAIYDALEKALSLRNDDSRNFTVVFLTDGQPTIGETSVPAIVKMVEEKSSGSTRVFVFGVGDDVNAHLLDQVAEDTRATSIYVRPKEDLEVKVSSFYAKISHPVMTDLKLSLAGDEIKLKEIYPPQLPDLFHGSQLVLLGRYSGAGESKLTLTGKVGSKDKEFTYEVKLPEEKNDNAFVADLWARRKVGYLLDQIRLKGENKELVDEVIALAKKFGIATPYTSYLVLPDEKEVARLGIAPAEVPALAADGTNKGRTIGGGEFGRSHGGFGGGGFAQDARESRLAEPGPSIAGRGGVDYVANEANAAGTKVAPSMMLRRQAGAQAVNVAEALAELKDAGSHGSALSRRIAGTTFSPLRGIWIDAAYKEGAEIVKIQYLSDAYFRVIELVPNARDVFALGERIVWQTPSGKAIVIDAEGTESLEDEAIRALFKND